MAKVISSVPSNYLSREDQKQITLVSKVSRLCSLEENLQIFKATRQSSCVHMLNHMS